MKLYVVAINRKEAEELAEKHGHFTSKAAADHLAYVKSPPTDPYYANQYRVYVVNIKP